MAETWTFNVAPGTYPNEGTIQEWTVPYTATYRIRALGAYGGKSPDRTRGADIAGEFTLTGGEVLRILVGQSPSSVYPNGGGGTFVYRNATDPFPLVAAGGGGGTRNAFYHPSDAGDGHGGVNPSATGAGPGGGWLSDGESSGSIGEHGKAPRNGGLGGVYTGARRGGFGGGGSSDGNNWPAGGGGFTGGDAFSDSSGWGGTSYNGGGNQTNQLRSTSDDSAGQVLITVASTVPGAPTLTSPADGATVDRMVAQRFTWRFNDANVGDSQSAYQFRYRASGTSAWTSIGWVASPSTAHTIPAGTLAEGSYEWQVATKDAGGLAGPFSPSGFFTAATPPPGPAVVEPANGVTIGLSTANLTWSVPDQDAYQVQVLDGAGVLLSDTGQVNVAATRSVPLPFPENNTTRTLQVRVLHEGLWSPWSSVTVTVSYTPPAVPSIALQSDDGAGSVTVTPGIPAPATGEPSVVAFDTWVRRVGELGDGTRIARDTPPSLDHTWWTPASGVDYEFRIQARGDNDTTTWSAWAGGPARYDESTYDAAAYA